MVRDGRAYKYAQWAVSETEGMVPHYVKVQAQQWMDIVDDYNEDAYVEFLKQKEWYRIMLRYKPSNGWILLMTIMRMLM